MVSYDQHNISRAHQLNEARSIGRALIGGKKGMTIEVRAPTGPKE
jgi:transcription elongation GreA/GreB family factor